MVERVLFATRRWRSKERGVFVALPLAAAECVIKSTDMPFADKNPFERGLLMFALAGKGDPGELATLLGVKDPAFVAIMAADLERDGLLLRHSGGHLVATQQAKEAYLGAPRSSQAHHGELLYFHDEARGYVVAGPLVRDCRHEPIEDHRGRVGWISAGTEGSPFRPRCLVPAIPSAAPPPMKAVDANRGVKEYLKRAGSKSAVIDVQPTDAFSVTLREPHWVRLLVKVTTIDDDANSRAPSRRRRNGQDHVVRIADDLISPHALRQLTALLQRDGELAQEFEKALERVATTSRPAAPREPAMVATDDPIETADSDQQTAPAVPIVINTEPTAALRQALCDRLTDLDSSSVHLPLIDDAATVGVILRARFNALGFLTDHEDGRALPFPTMPAPEVANARTGEWDEVHHLWVVFASWVLLDNDSSLVPLAHLLPNLPWLVAEAFWGMDHEQELNYVAEQVAALREVQI